MYGVAVRVFNQAVKRNAKRFPADFAFQLSHEEHEALRSQIVISRTERRGGRQYLPHAFTEHGAVMAAMVLNSPRAVEMSVEVVCLGL
ncbi:MAG: ORF6N domain-containing protein [Polyangia bacterium]